MLADHKDASPPTETGEATKSSPSGTGLGDTGVRAMQGSIDTNAAEEARLEATAGRLKQVEWLKPEKWAQLDSYEKATALNIAGRQLSEVYGHPSPPLLVKDMNDSSLLGVYGDGYRFSSDTGKIEGADYSITMNRAAEVDYAGLFGDDPSIAL